MLRIYAINLDHRSDRWQTLQANALAHGLAPQAIRRWSAVADPDFGALGCAKSHVAALAHFLTADDAPYALVLEDDFEFVRPFGELLQAVNALNARSRTFGADLQRAEVLEQRRFGEAELHQQVQASSDRARRLGGVLRYNDRVRNSTLQQWQQLGRRSLFGVFGAEAEHYNLRVACVNALHEVQQLNANTLSLGHGVQKWLR